MRHSDAGESSDDLRETVREDLAPRAPPESRIGEGHERIELSAGNRPEGGDQRREAGSGREAVGEKR
jgi:hypothetical protein